MNLVEPPTGRSSRQSGARTSSFGEILNARIGPTEARKPVLTQTDARNLAQSPNVGGGQAPPNAMKQNWLSANAGPYADLLTDNLTRTDAYTLGAVQIQWSNFSNGRPESLTRPVGTIDRESGQQLATLLGGTLMQSPFGTFGTQQKDQYIRMPNGQMIDASVLAHSLNQARGAKDPFSATQNVLEVYKVEASRFELAKSMDAVDGVSNGRLFPGSPNLIHSS